MAATFTIRTEKELKEFLDALLAKGITVSGLVLDNSWQKVDQDRPSQYRAGLVDFEADPGTFKSGLKPAVADIKSKHSSTSSIAIEHPIFGHWAGISDCNGPERFIQRLYETTCVQRSDAIWPNPQPVLTLSLVSPQDAQKFFDDYYR